MSSVPQDRHPRPSPEVKSDPGCYHILPFIVAYRPPPSSLPFSSFLLWKHFACSVSVCFPLKSLWGKANPGRLSELLGGGRNKRETSCLLKAARNRFHVVVDHALAMAKARRWASAKSLINSFLFYCGTGAQAFSVRSLAAQPEKSSSWGSG